MNDAIKNGLAARGIDPDSFRPSEFAPGVLDGEVPGTDALELWVALRAIFPVTKFWPLIRGEPSEQAEAYEYDPQHILAQVPHGSIRELLKPRLRDQVELLASIVPSLSRVELNFEEVANAVDASGVNFFGGKAKVRAWPTEPPHPEVCLYSTCHQSTGEPFSRVGFSLVPVQYCHEVPALLGFGGGNDAPPPELMVAALREWHREYSAVPACVAGDVLECIVDRPPQTEEEAMRLAAEQWIFCDDIVGQGTQSVRSLAIEIWRSPKWFFWWD